MAASNGITTEQVVAAARRMGASLAGVVGAGTVAESPDLRRIRRGFGWHRQPRSVLVVALAHPANRLSMDWWGGKYGTPGNWQLINIADRLAVWLKRRYDIPARNLPYHREAGGVFLKDAAVLAGLGEIGRHNLLITPDYGPRVRLRALRLDVDLDGSLPLAFSPCDGCDAPCIRACPQNAFESGQYQRLRCREQIRRDVVRRSVGTGGTPDVGNRVPYRTRFCRRCELACPVGRDSGGADDSSA